MHGRRRFLKFHKAGLRELAHADEKKRKRFLSTRCPTRPYPFELCVSNRQQRIPLSLHKLEPPSTGIDYGGDMVRRLLGLTISNVGGRPMRRALY